MSEKPIPAEIKRGDLVTVDGLEGRFVVFSEPGQIVLLPYRDGPATKWCLKPNPKYVLIYTGPAC